jgi:hypothetical protein
VDGNNVYMDALNAVMFVAESEAEHPEVLPVQSLKFSINGVNLSVMARGNHHYTTYWMLPVFGNPLMAQI